jgi:hypothetical protein
MAEKSLVKSATLIETFLPPVVVAVLLLLDDPPPHATRAAPTMTTTEKTDIRFNGTRMFASLDHE